jgi:lipoprotein NlpI
MPKWVKIAVVLLFAWLGQSCSTKTPPSLTYSYYFSRGLQRTAAGDTNGALADFNSGIKLKPNYIEAYYQRAMLKNRMGDRKGSLKDVKELIRLDPAYSQAYSLRGFLTKDLDNKTNAFADFNRALELNPRLMNAYLGRGEIKKINGDVDGAILDFDKAIQLNKSSALAYGFRGSAKLAKEDLDGALFDLNDAAVLGPKLMAVWINRGVVKSHLKDYSGAMEDFSEAIKLDATYSSGYRHRAGLEYALHDYPAALADLLKYHENTKTNGEYGEILIWVVRNELHDRQEADRELVKYFFKNGRAKNPGWLSEIANYLLGKKSEEELWSVIKKTRNQKAKAEQECEAWYYIGTKKRLAGDLESWKASMLKCIETERTYYFEYRWAEKELHDAGVKR